MKTSEVEEQVRALLLSTIPDRKPSAKYVLATSVALRTIGEEYGHAAEMFDYYEQACKDVDPAQEYVLRSRRAMKMWYDGQMVAYRRILRQIDEQLKGGGR